MLSCVSGPECCSSFFVLFFSFPLQNVFWTCFWSILRKTSVSLPEYLLKQPTKYVMFLYRLDRARVEWGHQLFRSLGKRIWPTLNSLESSLLGQCWLEAPVQPHESSQCHQCHQCHCPQQGNDPGRGAELCCAPDLIITSYYRCFGLFWILYILFWKSLVESQPLYI